MIESERVPQLMREDFFKPAAAIALPVALRTVVHNNFRASDERVLHVIVLTRPGVIPRPSDSQDSTGRAHEATAYLVVGIVPEHDVLTVEFFEAILGGTGLTGAVGNVGRGIIRPSRQRSGQLLKAASRHSHDPALMTMKFNLIAGIELEPANVATP